MICVTQGLHFGRYTWRVREKLKCSSGRRLGTDEGESLNGRLRNNEQHIRNLDHRSGGRGGGASAPVWSTCRAAGGGARTRPGAGHWRSRRHGYDGCHVELLAVGRGRGAGAGCGGRARLDDIGRSPDGANHDIRGGAVSVMRCGDCDRSLAAGGCEQLQNRERTLRTTILYRLWRAGDVRGARAVDGCPACRWMRLSKRAVRPAVVHGLSRTHDATRAPRDLRGARARGCPPRRWMRVSKHALRSAEL